MIARNILRGLLAALLICASPAWAFVNEAPSGWTTQSNATGLTAYIAPEQKGVIFVKTNPMPADGSLSTGAANAYVELLGKTCPMTEVLAPKILLNDRVAHIIVKAPGLHCSIAVGQQNGQLIIVGSIGEPAQNVEQMALDILSKRLGT
jgi:hypothetical protein